MNRSAGGSTDDTSNDAADPEATPQHLDVVHPAPHLVATVWGEPPQQPLDVLASIVSPELVNGLVVDWKLDAGISSRVDDMTIELFDQWRARWIRSNTLGTTIGVRRLHELVTELQPTSVGSVWTHAVDQLLGGTAEVWVSPDDLRVLIADCYGMRDMIQDRESSGFGVVDATPDRDRRGLAEAWPRPSSEIILARDANMTVALSPESGVVVRHDSDGSGPAERVVASVRLTVDSVDIDGADGTALRLPIAEAAPLTWLVPGSTHWRVREVPEVIVWSKTFAELPDCCEEARALGRPIRLSLDSPVRAISAGRRRT